MTSWAYRHAAGTTDAALTITILPEFGTECRDRMQAFTKIYCRFLLCPKPGQAKSDSPPRVIHGIKVDIGIYKDVGVGIGLLGSCPDLLHDLRADSTEDIVVVQTGIAPR